MSKSKSLEKFNECLNGCILPFFPGFYGSIFDLTEVEEDEATYMYDDYVDVLGDENVRKVKLSKDDFEASREELNRYKEEVCTYYVGHFCEYLPSWVEDVEFVELDSPRYYNYRTDEIICSVKLANNWKEQVRAFINEYYDDLSNDLPNDYGSRDGFVSFINTNVDDLLEETINDPERYIPLLLEYYMIYEEGENIADTLQEYTYEDTYMQVECTNEEANKLYYELR